MKDVDRQKFDVFDRVSWRWAKKWPFVHRFWKASGTARPLKYLYFITEVVLSIDPGPLLAASSEIHNHSTKCPVRRIPIFPLLGVGAQLWHVYRATC